MIRHADTVDFTEYQDEGCRFWEACLSCPFSRCIFELPGGARAVYLSERNRAMRTLFDRGWSVLRLAEYFSITRRSVYRALGGVRAQARPP